VGATWGHRPHNFLAVGAIAPIAPMESAPMQGSVATHLRFGEIFSDSVITNFLLILTLK